MDTSNVTTSIQQNKKLIGFFAVASTIFAVVVVLGLLMTMLGNFVIEGVPGLSWDFITQAPRNNNQEGGIFPAIYGTTILVLTMTMLGVPIGTITAIYLNEYANPNSFFSRLILFAVNSLAGVPSIVFGLFGVGFFIQFFGAGLDSLFNPSKVIWGQPAIIWASATLAVLTLPVVIISVNEALRSVPVSLREASLALGATKFQTIWKIVLPNSLTGILTGSILAIGRGAGEVAPIIFVGAVYSMPGLPHKLNDQFMHLGYHLFVLSTQSPNVEKTIPIQFATTLVLLLLTFVLSLTAIIIRSRLTKQLQG